MSIAAEQRFSSRILLATSSLLLWGAHFLFVYIFAALACARDFATVEALGIGIVPLVTAVVTIAALAGLTFFSALAWRGELRNEQADSSTPRLLRYLAGGLGIYSAVAILLQALPAILLPVCA
jgi:hypothetical protein